MDTLAEAQNPNPMQATFFGAGCKTHLDLGSNDGRTLRGLDKSTLTAVDLFEPSVDKLRQAGITAHCRDIREFVAEAISHQQHWDRVTCFDVIEHIPRADGERLLDQLDLIAMKEIILFVPIENPELEATEKWQQFRDDGLNQHPDAQRELHAHKSRWAPMDFERRGYITLEMPNFHYEGFGAFFAAKYRNPEARAAAMERVQELVKRLQPKPPEWGHLGNGARVSQALFVGGKDRMFLGDGVDISYGARLECVKVYNGVTYNPTLTIGDGTSAEFFLTIACAESVTIGRDCMIAGNVTITDHDHCFATDQPLHGQPLTVEPVQIGNSVFIGAGSFIGKGVTVGDHAVIGAGAVAVKDVPAYTVVAGVPAKVIRRLEPQVTNFGHRRRVLVVIPTIDVKSDRLKRCLDSIKANTENTLGRAGYVTYHISVIEDSKREGFAKACNRGIASKMAEESDYVLLLNDDVTVTEGWLSNMLAVMEHFPEVGLVGPVSDNVSGPQQREPLAGPISQEVSRLVGFCLLIRRSVVDKIGGIDEAYTKGMFTDDDYGLRAAAAGFKLRIALDAFVHHEFGASYKEADIALEEAMAQGWEVFSAKWGAEARPGGYMVNVPVWDPETCYVPLGEAVKA
jgi:acetyltransferase-like isoleucine patch superfamily enzyme